MKLCILFVCNIILFSCSKDELPKFNELNSIRVLALTTPTPEVNPGDIVTVTPVISDITEGGGLKDTAQTCIDIGVAYGVTPTCEGNPTKSIIHQNRTLTLPSIADHWTGNADTFSVTVPSALIIFNSRSTQEQFNGVNYLVEYILTNSSGIQIRSFKRIVVSTKTVKNSNPVITDIFSNGVTMTTLPVGSVVKLSSDLSAVSTENYDVQDSKNTVSQTTELLTVTWFITDGSTKYFRSEISESNEYTAPVTAPVGRSAYIIAVARDNRGGATVVRKKF
jgi:hypothetical protein